MASNTYTDEELAIIIKYGSLIEAWSLMISDEDFSTVSEYEYSVIKKWSTRMLAEVIHGATK